MEKHHFHRAVAEALAEAEADCTEALADYTEPEAQTEFETESVADHQELVHQRCGSPIEMYNNKPLDFKYLFLLCVHLDLHSTQL